ncbi:ubiquitin-like protein Pup [Ornithinimicrobium kibberense]|uniref:Prokaryotic ubiquitin-like protein Pup n=1 Tax=Ornithinimicrobium kibberense TaxID=282060 RepID=A0ABV5V4R0_9MICO|nr:ubiquitin-like protein Pup [Ornithinimicrobium kibberense]
MSEQQKFSRRRDDDAPEPETPAPSAPQVQGVRRDEELDSLLDEIDGVLETNAQDFVHGFIQKGGQ